MEQVVVDQPYDYEVTLQTLNAIATYEKFEGVYWVFLVNIVVVKDPYGFRLLEMERWSKSALVD